MMKQHKLFEQVAHHVRPYSANAHLPEGTIRVDTYERFRSLIRKWADGKFDDTLVVIGGAARAHDPSMERLIRRISASGSLATLGTDDRSGAVGASTAGTGFDAAGVT